MKQDEHNENRSNSVAKLQAIKEVTKRVIGLDEDETHGLIIIEAIDEGDGITSESRMLLEGSVAQALPLLNALLKTASEIIDELPDGYVDYIKENRKLEVLGLFLQSAEVGSKLMKWTDIGEE
jgi:hypothetical protein